MDTVTKSLRSRMMAAVPQKDSAPELVVRRIVHSMGYRFRLHLRKLPGSPDLVLPSHKKIIFVHGCFWHRHSCKFTTTPKSRQVFWQAKFAANQARDKRNIQVLRSEGWKVLVVWACWTRRPERLQQRIASFLQDR